MELVLWRHADAEDGLVDMKRALTDKGRRQAARVAKWLRPRMEDKWEILVSPALRARQTADALDLEYDVRIPLGPSASEDALLREAKWPANARNVLIVGHQPTLGATVAQLLAMQHGNCPVRKGAVWWIRNRERDGHAQTLVVAVQSPDVL